MSGDTPKGLIVELQVEYLGSNVKVFGTNVVPSDITGTISPPGGRISHSRSVLQEQANVATHG